MTPKEKAKEIYDEMKSFRGTNKDRKSKARKCVKQIIEALENCLFDNKILPTFQTKYFDDHIEFYNQVLTEIEKL